ncbi:hypothetical protein DHW03_16345 [Pedobacter yonginense]|uniref:Tetratricopeptide repeat protein n=1 Tax=Pedobacter yonginense TaxID=651869 RepID=A0A317EHR6_9SPHI|nr:hypothetical protein [Pedobacter yonginense]PWS26350.1 hypothetical protein DHW03_16345 [Pedobacter yonginense]
MNNSEENTELVLKYLDGELTEAEQLSFETSLKSNIAMQQEFENLKTAKLGLKHYGLKADVAAVHQDMMHAIKGNDLKVHKLKWLPNIFKIAASIFVILFLALSYKFFSVNPERIYEEQYIPYTIGIDRGNANTNSLEIAYQNQDYQAVIAVYKQLKKASTKELFLAAQAYSKLNDLTNAIIILQYILQTEGNEGPFHDDAEYYLGLAYMWKHDYNATFKIFEKIYQDKSHVYHEKVSLGTLFDLKLLALKK